MGEDGRLGRQHYVIGIVVALGVLTLYVALGGPLPLIVEGGPALDSVPAEADAVVYSDAWTFSSDTSRDVANGLLTATDESVPGYAGPASLDAAVEALQGTDLDTTGLRSVTAFTGYGSRGQPTDYGGLVMKTGWEVNAMLAAFGDDRDRYTERRRHGRTVYVHEDDGAQFPWVAKLGPDRFVLGNESAVRDSINATAGREAMDPTLRSGFRSLPRGPIRFASTTPDALPGQQFAPEGLTDTVDAIETIGGVYYPAGDDAAVELEMTASDAGTAERIEPAVTDGIDFARDRVPQTTAALLDRATVTRQRETVRVTMTGETTGFVDGYRAFLQADLVRLLLGQSVGTPALDLVPTDASVVGYADAGVVADPTTFGVARAVLSRQNLSSDGEILDTVEGVQRLVAVEPTAFRSVTLFSAAETASNATNATGSAAIVEADWSREAIARTIDNRSLDYETRTVAGTPVFVLDTDAGERWVAVLDGHQAVGPPPAVRTVIAVDSGERQAVGGRFRDAFEALPGRDLALVVKLPASVTEADPGGLPDGVDIGESLQSAEFLGLSYHSDLTAVEIRVNLYMATSQDAFRTRGVLEIARQVALNGVDDERIETLVESTRLGQSGRVVTADLSTDSGSVIAVADWVLERLEAITFGPLSEASTLVGPGSPADDPGRAVP